MMSLTLALGGARSGKSAYAQRAAETWASARRITPLFMASAEPGDSEMAERIERAQPGAPWRRTSICTAGSLGVSAAGLRPRPFAPARKPTSCCKGGSSSRGVYFGTGGLGWTVAGVGDFNGGAKAELPVAQGVSRAHPAASASVGPP